MGIASSTAPHQHSHGSELKPPARVAPQPKEKDSHKHEDEKTMSNAQGSKYADELEKFHGLNAQQKQEAIASFVMSKIHGRMHSHGLRGSVDREDLIDGIYGTVVRGGKFKESQLDNIMQQAIKLAELADMVAEGAKNFPASVIGMTTDALRKKEDHDPNLFWLSAESLVYEQRINGAYKKFWTDDSFSTYAVNQAGQRVVPGYDPASDLALSTTYDPSDTPIDPAAYAGLKTPGRGSRVRYSAHNLKANAKACADLINEGFPGINNIYGYCHRNIAGTNRLSNHARGKALDFMITGHRSAEGIAHGDAIAAFLIANADTLQIRRFIWRGKTWDRNRNGWKPYSHPGGSNDTLNHFDHLHVDFK